MEEKLEKLMKLAGNENRYQYFVLIVCILYWVNANILTVSLPFLENPPDVSYYDPVRNETVVESLSYEICNWEGNYTIVNTYDYSWVSELGIACDQVKVGLIGTLTFTGNMLGAIIFSLISKPLGQKLTLSASTGIFSSFLLFALLFPSYSFILVICSICCASGNFICFSSIVLCEEITSSKLRSTFGNLINLGYAGGGIFQILLYMYVGNWKYIFIICISLCLILGGLELFFFFESPRNSLQKSPEKMLKTLRGIAKFNGQLEYFNLNILKDEYIEIMNYFNKSFSNRKPGQDILEDYYSIELVSIEGTESYNEFLVINNKELPNKGRKGKKKIRINAFSLLKYKSLRIPFIIINIVWFCSSGIYNGLIIGVKTLPGNIYVNGIMLYCLEILGYLSSALLMNHKLFGRKYTIMGGLIGGCVMILFVVGFIDNDTVATIFYIATNFFLTNVYTVFYTYSLESYPTPIRSLGFGINAAFANAGGVVVPLAIEMLSGRAIYIVFVVLAACCALIFIPMKETVGKPMVETINELELKRNTVDSL